MPTSLRYKHCDKVTRATRRLAKQTLMFDMKDMTFSELVDGEQQKLHGMVSKVSSFVYPQLMRKMCCVNAPKFITIALKIAAAFMPKSTLEKIQAWSTKEKFAASEFFANYVHAEHLPECLGGQFPDSKLPDFLTGALVVEDGEGDYNKVKVSK